MLQPAARAPYAVDAHSQLTSQIFQDLSGRCERQHHQHAAMVGFEQKEIAVDEPRVQPAKCGSVVLDLTDELATSKRQHQVTAELATAGTRLRHAHGNNSVL